MSFGKPDARRRFEEYKEERREERRDFDGFEGARSVGSRHSGHDDSGVGADPEVGGVLVRDLHDELKLSHFSSGA